MFTERIQQLAALKAKVSALESEINAERDAALASLPGQFGFATVDEFIAAVMAARGKRRGRKPKGITAAVKSKPATGRRKRAVITDTTRAAVKKLVGAGKTGGEIAKTLGISLPSVHNIKKALGLVKKK